MSGQVQTDSKARHYLAGLRTLKKIAQGGSSKSKAPPEQPEVEGKDKADEISSLLDKLRLDLTETNLTSSQRVSILRRLKVLGRKPEDADPLFSKEGIEILGKQSLGSNPEGTAEGLRCLANGLLLKPETRQFFVEAGFAPKVARILQSEQLEDQFLSSRVLFLLTYDTDLDFQQLNKDCRLCSSINEALSQHCRNTLKRSKKQPRPQLETDALSETLKLLFNLTHHYLDLCPPLNPSVPYILKMILKMPSPMPVPILQAPLNYLINALMNLDLPEKIVDLKSDAEILINILDDAIEDYELGELDKTAAPLLTFIRRIYEDSPENVRRFMAWLLLPTPDERKKPLGQSNTLSARLLRLSISSSTPNLKEPISSLMFELSNKDVDTFVGNIGYGFAAGFLASHDMPIPSSEQARIENATILHGGEPPGTPSSPGSPRSSGFPSGMPDLPRIEDVTDAPDSDETPTTVPKSPEPGPDDVNFVTGQYLINEEQDTEEAKKKEAEDSATGSNKAKPPMTEDEKLREAEKMFVLFERLKATGVVDVKNPVEEAMRRGDFEKMDEDGNWKDAAEKRQGKVALE